MTPTVGVFDTLPHEPIQSCKATQTNTKTPTQICVFSPASGRESVFECGESDQSFWRWQCKIQPTRESRSEPNYPRKVGRRQERRDENQGVGKETDRWGDGSFPNNKTEGAVGIWSSDCRWRAKMCLSAKHKKHREKGNMMKCWEWLLTPWHPLKLLNRVYSSIHSCFTTQGFIHLWNNCCKWKIFSTSPPDWPAIVR